LKTPQLTRGEANLTLLLENLAKKGVYKLEVYQEDSQAYGYLVLKAKNGKYVIIKSVIGSF
jgi:hypothetical protein